MQQTPPTGRPSPGAGTCARPSAADGDSGASLPAVHHCISNLKAKLQGTCHGVTAARIQEHLDEFGWKYSHRRGDQLADLLAELVRWPHVRLRDIREVAQAQPAHAGALDPGYWHNRRLERRRARGCWRDLATVVAQVARLKEVP